MARPPAPVPATSPDTVFSAERALRHVEAIAVRPHAMGMPDHARVRDYIVAELTALGLKPQIQDATAIGTRYQASGRVQNILAWLPGSDVEGKAVLLMTHYDGVAAGPAAADDGAGSAALLETLRALRARKQPLAHNVVALFTDGEEAGLLGAAAFVREQSWAKRVAVVINLDARGTSGRSLMFETGPGNLDAARALRAAGDVTAGSVFTTVYRVLPNDTDLSELAVLGLPALNFAFIDGVERYHTSHDDFAHLNAGSLQHHGAQMLAVTRAFAGEALPRPTTGDAVFFDLPVVGLIVYPVALALPLAIVVLVLVGMAIVRDRKWIGVAIGALVTLIAVGLSGAIAQLSGSAIAALHARLPGGGAPQWRGIYAAAIALLAVAVTLACMSVAKRRTSERSLYIG
ncbi:MAG TPA: M20/M25/M40 family metallo-hydrolase, partial [Gemmatimonadaceae bacterium]|nr:M20/M25/M40 family metallo-hydrolase [Gemmatimonadaceae bacterium]